MSSTVLRWNRETKIWQPADGEVEDGPAGEEIGLFETLRTDATGYALGIHGQRIVRSWGALGGSIPFPDVPGLPQAAEAARAQNWFAFRYEVRGYAGGRAELYLRCREQPPRVAVVRLWPVHLDESAAYPHKVVDRRVLMQAYERAVAHGADDALIVVQGEVRETARAFVGLAAASGLILPPLRSSILPSTTRMILGAWCREQGRSVTEEILPLADLTAKGCVIYGNAVIGVLPAQVLPSPASGLPRWLDTDAIQRRMFGEGPL